jgi:radical SAM superfamily enzyme YgiQ (UPF0313 family)
MRPLVLVAAPNPFADARAPAHEFDFWVRTRSGQLASFANLVHQFNRVGASRPVTVNPGKTARPLAGYYLESFLKTHGYDARAVFQVDDSGAWAKGSPGAPLAVALSTTFITSVAELGRILVRVRSGVGPDVPIVVGGQLVWKQYMWGPDAFAGRADAEGLPELTHLFASTGDPVLREPVYVASEFGEHTLLNVLAALARGARAPAELCDIENLVLWTPGGWRMTPRALEPVDLDGDYTRWDLVDEMPSKLVPVRSSVGCPHECEFCDFSAVHPRVRLRSPSSIVDELRLIAARGGTSICFVDDNALSSARRARALAGAMRDSQLGLRWAGYLRADRVAADDADLLAGSGLMCGWCGIESGDPEMLQRMRKRSDPEAARLAIDALTGAGVNVQAYFVLGFPGETRASVDATVGFLNRLRRDARGTVEYLAWPFYLLPGAPVDRPERRRALGLTGMFDRWRHSTMSSEDVHDIWAPYLFRAVDTSYSYYGGDNSALWSAARRNEAIAHRKALAVSFVEGAADEVVQDRFAALYRTLRFGSGETPAWRDQLAPREQQPGAGCAASRRPLACGGG